MSPRGISLIRGFVSIRPSGLVWGFGEGRAVDLVRPGCGVPFQRSRLPLLAGALVALGRIPLFLLGFEFSSRAEGAGSSPVSRSGRPSSFVTYSDVRRVCLKLVDSLPLSLTGSLWA